MNREQREKFQRFVDNPLHNVPIADERGNIYLGHEKSLMQQHAQMLLDEDARHPDQLQPFTYYVVEK